MSVKVVEEFLERPCTDSDNVSASQVTAGSWKRSVLHIRSDI